MMSASWQLFQLPLVNNAWIEHMYNNVAMSLPPAVQQKKKSFNIADILSDDTNQLERDIGKMASHPYYPATQQYTESAGKASIFILTCFLAILNLICVLAVNMFISSHTLKTEFFLQKTDRLLFVHFQ